MSRKFAEFLERHDDIIRDKSCRNVIFLLVRFLLKEENWRVSNKWMWEQLSRLQINDYNYNCIKNDEDLPREQL